MKYVEINIASANGLNIKLHVSSCKNANGFVASLTQMISQKVEANDNGINAKVNDGSILDKQSINGETPYEILGIKHGASSTEIYAAYKQKAQMYHPDKVSHLALEFKELAESKMKKINKAYELLK